MALLCNFSGEVKFCSALLCGATWFRNGQDVLRCHILTFGVLCLGSGKMHSAS